MALRGHVRRRRPGPTVLLWALVAGSGTFGGAQTARTIEDARQALDRGAYAEAERVAAEVSARVNEESGAESIEVARAQDLVVEALLKNGHAGAPGTLALAERVVRLKEQRAGPDHPETASSLHNLGEVRAERGEFTEALAAHQRGLAIRSRQAPPDAAAVADSRDHVAWTLIQLERFEDARQTLAQSQAVRESQANRSPLALARTLELVGWLNRSSSKSAAAREPVERALSIRRQLGPQHPDIIRLIELRGDLLYLAGDIPGARTDWTDALALGEKTLRPEHPTIPALQRRLAVIAKAFGNLTDGRQLLERSLYVAEQSLAPCHPELPGLLNDLASAVAYDGEFAEARRLYDRALTIREKCLGPAHSLVAGIVFNEANLAIRMGDLAQAEKLHSRAVRMWTAAFGANSVSVARGLEALGQVVYERKQIARARTLYQRALTIRRGIQGKDHPQVARTLYLLAQADFEQGRLDPALRQVEEAIATYQRAGVSEEPADLAFALALRGYIETRRGDFAAARASAADALAVRDRVFGKGHMPSAGFRAEFAAADFALGHDEAALAEALEAERAGRDLLRFTVRYLPERQALTYADWRAKGLDVALSIVAARPVDEPARVFDGVIQSRSVILDEMAARARSAVGTDAALITLNTALVAARQRFANLTLRSASEGDAGQRAMLNEARQQKENAERALADRSAAVRAELVQSTLGIEAIRRALPANSALVSFVRYSRTTFWENSAHVRLVRTAPAYIALVMRAGASAVGVVPLGSATSIDALVTRWRGETMGVLRASSSSDAEKSYRVAGTTLRQKVWDPLREHLKDTALVFVVPDGTLNLVPLAALPVGATQYLIDQGPVIHYLSAERDLVSSPSQSAATRGLLAVGGAAFDDASSFTPASKRVVPSARAVSNGSAAAASLRATCGTLQSMQFQPLAGTGREVHEVARLWTGSPSQILENRDATERAFKREAPGHRVLHLATHGFFLDGLCPPAAAGTRSVGGLSTGQKSEPKPGLGENPLLLAGLALAGANRRAIAGPADEDGILTAEEVTALNLEGVEWAVLSACDTGLGEVKAGEGVFGLRRAFQVAGVRTVIMSLWSVDDQAARLWMRTLYERRLQKNLSTAEALHEASLSVLRDRRARGQSTHPFYWAGFVAAGDWR